MMSRTSFFQDMLSAITDQGRRLLPLAGSLPGDAEGLAAACDNLLSTRGEASGVALARQILDGFQALDAESQLAFYHILAERYDPDPEKVKEAAEAYATDPSPTTLNQWIAPKRACQASDRGPAEGDVGSCRRAGQRPDQARLCRVCSDTRAALSLAFPGEPGTLIRGGK